MRERVIETAVAASRAEASALWADLERFRFEDQHSLIRSSPCYLSWGLCELLCRESRKIAASDAMRAVELGELAVLVSDLIKTDEPAETPWLFQLRGYAWAHVGNARRVLGDLRNADEAFAISEPWWEAGVQTVGDVLGYGPVLLDLEASLRISQRRFPEALALLDRASVLCAERRDLHWSGRLLVTKALAMGEMGEPESAIQMLAQAAGLLDPERDPRLNLCVQHNLVWNFTTVGRYEEAGAMLPELWALSRELGNPLDLLRLRWAEGRIDAALGRTESAIPTFGELQQEFADRGMAFDAALVSLELAALYAETNRISEVKELAREMVTIFQAHDVSREALAALLLFERVAARRRATAKLAREVAAFLEKSRYSPDLRFERARRR
jgi:tetratricopeptide (TPR) repeat protein